MAQKKLERNGNRLIFTLNVCRTRQIFPETFFHDSKIDFTKINTSSVEREVLGKEKIKEIIFLLEQGRKSQRQISREYGVSRGSVSNISRNLDEYKLRITQHFDLEPSGPWGRCPQCGGKTQLPCTFCELKKLIACGKPKPNRNFPSGDDVSDGIDLKGKHLERYLEIKAWRDKQDNPYFRKIPEDWPWRPGGEERNSETDGPETPPRNDSLQSLNRPTGRHGWVANLILTKFQNRPAGHEQKSRNKQHACSNDDE